MTLTIFFKINQNMIIVCLVIPIISKYNSLRKYLQLFRDIIRERKRKFIAPKIELSMNMRELKIDIRD